MSGAEILIRSLEDEGVETIFGYPGGQALPIYDALYDSKNKPYTVPARTGRGPRGGRLCRATGKPGVCLATSGPGATNLVTGIATAFMDSVPMVAITGQVPLSLLGRDSFQEADITGITLPITKHSYLVRDTSELAQTVKEAIYIATTGRPGPVLIDVPRDVSSGQAEYRRADKMNLPGLQASAGRRPCAGGGSGQGHYEVRASCHLRRRGVVISGAHEELLQLAELLMAPVCNTLTGLGGFPGNHPYHWGCWGCMEQSMPTTPSASAISIAVGARFDDRVTGDVETFAPEARIIHIDMIRLKLGKMFG